MGVQQGILIADFLSLARDIGFKLISCEDLSAHILPNVRHIQSMQNYLFPNPFILKFARSILPKYLVRNVIAGMLMPYMIEQGIQGYYRISLQRI